MTRHRTVVPALLFLALASRLGAQPTALEEGVRLFREGRFDQALGKLEEAHRIAPRDAAIENLLGITETKLGRVEEAGNHYRDAIRIDPSLAAAHRNLGFNQLAAKDYAGAEPELREASRLNPADNFAHYYLLQLALATGHDAAAMRQASQAGQLLDNDPDAGAALVEAEVRMGRVDEAASRIEALETANQLPSPREYEIAALLSQRAYYRQAVHCFRRIASVDPSWEHSYNLALALLYDHEAAEASTLLASLHTERPAHADTLMFLGAAFEMQQKMPEALEAYRAALAADPSNPDRTLDYTRLLMDMDRDNEAIQVVQARIGEASSTTLQLRLGAVEMVKGDYDGAREAFREALAADPNLDAAYVGLAQTYARQGDDAEAVRILGAAREHLPGRYPLEYYFGLLASRLGREREAIAALENAAELEPKYLDPFYELGKIYGAQENWPQARQALEHAVELNPQFVPAHYQLSRVYIRLGLNSRAAQEAQETRSLVDAQREQALRRQRERGERNQVDELHAKVPEGRPDVLKNAP